MKLIVGLGNPGPKYQDTRHNIGFMVVERLARELSTREVSFKEEAKHKALLSRVGDVILLKPQTFMNSTGIAVASVVSFYKLEGEDVWVVHDDIDLPLGKIRIRMGGASAGHNGVDSIIRYLKTDKFLRFRLGIGRGKEAKGPTAGRNLHHRWVIDFVLSRFTQHEAGSLRHLVKRGAEAVRIGLIQGIDKAMNRFN